MKIQEIINHYNNGTIPDSLEELAAMQSKVDDFAKSSLGFAQAATDETIQTLHFNEHVSYNAISSFLDSKITSVIDKKGGVAQ